MNLLARVVVTALATALAAAPGGCQTEKERAADSAVGGLEYFRDDLAKTPAQIDATVSALEAATGGAVPDRKAAISRYSKELRTLNGQAAGLARARDNAESHTQEFFRQWLKETRTYKSTAERDAAIKAYEGGKANQAQALEYIRLGARDFRALTDRLNSAESSLQADGSTASALSVGQSLGPIHDSAIKVKAYIERLDEQIAAALARN